MCLDLRLSWGCGGKVTDRKIYGCDEALKTGNVCTGAALKVRPVEIEYCGECNRCKTRTLLHSGSSELEWKEIDRGIDRYRALSQAIVDKQYAFSRLSFHEN